MAQKVLILGDSGTGKSASLRNFKDDEVFVINCAGKPLPFKNHFQQMTPSFKNLTNDIKTCLEHVLTKSFGGSRKKVIVIDDAQYIMSFQYMRRIHENGWDKWNDIQGDFFDIIQMCDDGAPDTIVYFMSHLSRNDDGFEKIKTMGKMLDEKITIEGLFTTVLKTSVADGKYFFLTQNSGKDTVKSPIGMFPSYAIDNDLKYVDTKIRNYYEIGDYVPDEEVAQLDQEVAKPEVAKPDADGRRRRKARTEEPKEADSGNKKAEKPVEQAVETTDDPSHPFADDVMMGDSEEAPKKRRSRKERNGENKEEKPEEAPAEEKKEESAAEASGAKRRRRKQRDDFQVVNDDDLPF